MPVPYHCTACGRHYPAQARVWRCECGHHLDVPEGEPFDRHDIDAAERSLWRYRKALHLRDDRPTVSYGEGLTPLVERPWGGRNLHFKVDFLMPSGSFKDRGSALLVNRLAELGVTEIVEDSSGNGGASIAAYAAAADMRCRIFVPASTSEGKLVQLRAYGAEVVTVEGSREDTATAAQAAAERAFYASHNWHPLFVEGVKTVAFELWEDLGYRAPAAVILPSSFGSNLLGLHRGFSQLLRAGAIERLPRLFACQAANCAPLHALHTTGSADVEPKPTIAEGIAGRAPIRTDEMLRAVRLSGGDTVAVPEEEIAPALVAFARSSGLFVEPTTAVALAAARRLASSGRLPDGPVAVLLTGNGLKATGKIAPFLDPSSQEVPVAPRQA